MRNFSNWIRAYMDYSSLSESPDKFHFWTAISTLAGAVRRRVYLPQRYFEWVPNFYIVFVAPPGIVSKTTTASIGMNLLRDIEGVNFGPDVVTWQALVTGFAGAREIIEHEDGTLEPFCAMTISSSEFGNLLNPQDREMVDLLVSLWDGQRGTLKKTTKTQGDDTVENPWLNILACTTPHWISGTFPEYMIGGGFTSRCVFVYGEEKRRLVAYPGKHIPEGHFKLKQQLQEDLAHISQLQGPFSMTAAADEYGEAWYAQHNEKLRSNDYDQRLQGYLARKQTHMHKLAMILALARSDELVIDVDHLVEAEDLLNATEPDMHKVFAHIGVTRSTQAAEGLVSLVRSSKSMPLDAAFRVYCRSLTKSDFEEVVSSACATGYVKKVSHQGRIYLVADTPPEEAAPANAPSEESPQPHPPSDDSASQPDS